MPTWAVSLLVFFYISLSLLLFSGGGREGAREGARSSRSEKAGESQPLSPPTNNSPPSFKTNLRARHPGQYDQSVLPPFPASSSFLFFKANLRARHNWLVPSFLPTENNLLSTVSEYAPRRFWLPPPESSLYRKKSRGKHVR